ncbi:single-stranded DNA-binding protein [Mycoplasma sp. 744]|uniref:single-stranded DNA-binding protein n=1 Tax=Mycoplasma sp. 744 TaxID=3108531 RepID=UPI002B1E6732|nr:single-stranded DNA-binding protein [Mycoplasma sp. 744]MEA4115637.1 single-stranded DNA-binding protein [Mycoplasma sp. 744]
MNLNKVVLIGRFSNMFYSQTASGISYLRCTIAINRRTTQNVNETVDFIPVILWRQTADFIHRNCEKGDLVSVEGNIQTSQYKNKNGDIVNDFVIVAESINQLETRAQREYRRNKQYSNYTTNNDINDSVNKSINNTEHFEYNKPTIGFNLPNENEIDNSNAETIFGLDSLDDLD